MQPHSPDAIAYGRATARLFQAYCRLNRQRAAERTPRLPRADEELLAVVRQHNAEAGFTLRDLCDWLNIPLRTAQRRVTVLISLGLAESNGRQKTAGRSGQAPIVYRLTEQEAIHVAN